ncbi:MAG: hypothetical protein LBH73_01860 [Spirochaetaceae bacterium]|jgi:hypothetical protein|nr:hypothetical protein [Spirochaetaceae bacterium]
MKTLNCDVCGHTLENAIPDRTYWHIGARDICESCKDGLEVVLKPEVRARQPFSYDWYLKTVADSIEKAVSKGKF